MYCCSFKGMDASDWGLSTLTIIVPLQRCRSLLNSGQETMCAHHRHLEYVYARYLYILKHTPHFCLRTGLLFISDAVYEKFLISEVFFCIEIAPWSGCLFLFCRRSNRPCLPLEASGTGNGLWMRELINRLLGFAIPTLAFKNYHLLYMGKKGRGWVWSGISSFSRQEITKCTLAK